MGTPLAFGKDEFFTYQQWSVTMRFVQRLLGRGDVLPLERPELNDTPGLAGELDHWNPDLEDVFGGSGWMRFPFGIRHPGDVELP